MVTRNDPAVLAAEEVSLRRPLSIVVER